MPLTKEEPFESAPTPFVRGSKMRKTFRIRQRYNSKLPPAAVLFMKSLEQNTTNNFDTIRTKCESFKSPFGPIRSKSGSIKSNSSFYLNINESLEKFDYQEEDCSLIDCYDPLVDETQLLIKKSPNLRRRNSIKKSSGKKKLKISKIISFFRK